MSSGANNNLKDIKIFKLKPIGQKGFDISGQLENPTVEKYMETVRLELRRVSLNSSTPIVQNIGIILIALGCLILLSLWARIIWVYSSIISSGLAFTITIIVDIVISIVIAVIGIYFLGDEKHSKNTAMSAKRLNRFFSNAKGTILNLLNEHDYELIWTVDSVTNNESEVIFVGGRNKTQMKKVEKLIGGFVVYKKGRLENWMKINNYLSNPELPENFEHNNLYLIERELESPGH